MRLVRMMIAGSALVSSAAFAVVDSENPTQSEAQSPSAQVMQESQMRDNPWFSQGQENPWSSAARSESDSALSSESREPNQATEPGSTLSESGAPPSEASTMASPLPSETESPVPVPADPTASETYTPPMGLGTDTYRS